MTYFLVQLLQYIKYNLSGMILKLISDFDKFVQVTFSCDIKKFENLTVSNLFQRMYLLNSNSLTADNITNINCHITT